MNKWALVTGAASGLGFEFAKLLAKDNFNLVLIDLQEQALIEKEMELKASFAVEIKSFAFDLGVQDAAQSVYHAVEDLKIELEMLVNNAGFGMFGTFASTDWEREEKMINLHVYTPTQLVKLFLPQMQKRDSGKILNVSSLAAFHPGPLMCMYYSTKAYLLSFSTSVATELKGTGVSMTVLCPGITKTGFQKAVGSSDPKISVNMASAEQVASFGYKAMIKGKVLAVPGFMNNFILFIRRFVPLTSQAKIVMRIQEKNRQKK
ncbi:SDR family NAD(P)-dependent oxidoreductase [Mangrovibacterium lignilyticum]|uniref:SDR family NAD(P)-dependent oxidoreductase n=1 Tax=Mangrovibacterium lignilyticum TaxID=2668052 RepID=UPI0013D7CEBD|nr:SDR family oxidoreductase [Mangrovibacterium lignilyticum]